MDIDYAKHKRILNSFKPAKWFTTTLFVVGGVGLVFTILGLVLETSELTSADLATLLPALAVSAWLFIKSSTLGLRATKYGFEYRGIFRTRHITYGEFDHFEVSGWEIEWLGDIGSLPSFVFSAPVMHLKSGETLVCRTSFSSAESVTFKAELANYFVAPRYYETIDDPMITQEILDILETAQKFTPTALVLAGLNKIKAKF